MSARQGKQTAIGFDEIVGGAAGLLDVRTVGDGPAGRLPLTPEMLLEGPSGDVFGWTQNAGMGWDPRELGRPQFLILSTQGGIRAPDGQPIALGYHTGHWEVGLLMEAAASELRQLECLPFAGFVTDPCDGRTQGTVGMMDSLPYRNDAAQVFRRLIRSLPTRRGVLGIATCDKGLPAMMMALAAMRDLPCVLVPGGVTLPARDAEDAGTVQSIGAGSPTARSRSSGHPTWGVARAARRAAAASSSAPPRRPRWSARRWASRSPTRPWPRPASRSGSTRRGARRAPWSGSGPAGSPCATS